MLKQLEIAWRTLWIRILTRLMRSGEPRRAPDWNTRPHRVLFLRHDRIGDMILSTGLLRVIATSQRNVRLDVLASPANAPVVRGDPHVDSVVVFDRTKPSGYLAAVRRLRRARYDAVIDCMPTAPSLTTLLLILASGARHRIGVAGRGNDDAFTLLVQPLEGARHIVDHLAALAAAFGVDARTADFRPRLYVHDGERAQAVAVWDDHPAHPSGRRLLVNISAGRPFRRWPDGRFVQVIRHARVRDPHLSVVVIAAPNEGDRASGIAREAGVRYVRTPTLREALALVATADLVFTPDTGLAHAAAALDRAAVVMYIHGTAVGWGLYRSVGHQVSSADASLASLPVGPVIAALDQLIGEPVADAVRSEGMSEGGRFVRPTTGHSRASLRATEG
jgi:ADP-heptose:LPS heptosyltransferase